MAGQGQGSGMRPRCRAVLRVGGPPAPHGPDEAFPVAVFEPVRKVVHQWLNDKFNITDPLASGVQEIDENRSLALDTAFDRDGAETATRVQLTEALPNGLWRTTVTACGASAGTGALVCVELECGDLAGAADPQPPRLIRELLQVLPVHDGPVRLAAEPVAVGAGGVPDLLEVLTEPARRMPVIVAARPPRPDEEWQRRWRRIVQRSAGMATLVELDETAVEPFRQAVYHHHRVAAGAVRTFMPEVDPAWEADALRHRVLSFGRLHDPADHAWQLIAANVQRIALAEPIPPDLRLIAFPGPPDDGEVRRQRALDAAADTGTGPDDLRREIGILTELLEESDRLLLRQEAEAREQARRLEEAAELHRRVQDDLVLSAVEHMETQAELDRAQAELRLVRRALLGQGRAGDAFPPLPAAQPPDGFEDLLDRLDELPHLLFSGDRRATLELDDTDANRAPTWARKAWNALQALDSYADLSTRDGGFPGDFRAFCRDTPADGHPVSANQVVMGESKTVHNQWADERMLPVPPEIDPSKRILMTAHIRLASKGSISPRIYFHDDTAGLTGKIVVGFIGRHMTNTRT
ncbi:hypothetical protein [Actinomadura parmotrematis]|uniref:Uncharacterized protein n=1 Tax=Actinomadura parmotrematis TaxID=2864039 RepID=A0ABS7FUR8_9ACTN|nr:hypothetical protein [Actinomadura parmotrematis]MBW8484160.1 hypothetical protein [Actinomadura parmotrematis]